MNDNYNYCHVVGKTDVGRKRAANEDNMYNTITQNGLVSVVCDGMGGHVGGATASKIAVSTIIENLNNVYYDDPRIAIGESIDKANRAIIQKTIEQPELAGMGSTCVLLLVRSGKVYIGHVGDSRIYLVRSKRIVQLTKDHSYVQMLVDCGEITKEQAEHHPRKNEITNALGIPNMSPATVADDAIIPEAGDCFVLCSDGLSGMVSDHTICKIISRQSEMNAQERVDKLVALANDNGGVDNITVQLVEFPVSPNVETDKKKFPTWAKITCVISVLLALGVGGYFWLREKQSEADDIKQAENAEQVAKPRSTINLGSIDFKKNKKIIEFEFTDSNLKFIINNEVIYTENVIFEPTSLVLKTETEYITKTATSDNRKLWLSFTDKIPGEIIEISLTTIDKTEVYNYSIDVKNTENKGGLSIPKGTTPQQGPEEGPKKADPKEGEIVVKIDTVYVQFEYDTLENGSKLLLNYSANPTLIFINSKKIKVGDKKIESPMLEKVLEGLAYDVLYWDKDSKKGQFSFIFKGESSDSQHILVIPCAVKGSEDQVIISVILVPKKKENGNVTPTEKNEEDNNKNYKQPNSD